MIRRTFRFGIRLGLLAGIAFALYKLAQARRITEPLPATPPRRSDPWPPVAAPEPSPPVVQAALAPTAKKAPAKKKAAPAKKGAKKAAPARGWVEPEGAVCPLSHPIKAKLSSHLYHLPGMAAYARTNADRCYAAESAAKRDGFTPAKR